MIKKFMFVFFICFCIVNIGIIFAQDSATSEQKSASTESVAPAESQPVASVTETAPEGDAVSKTPAESIKEEVVAPVKDVPAVAKEEETGKKVKGLVKSIAEDNSSIMVDDTKILTTTEFLEDSYLAVGDKVEITVEETKEGLKATSYSYVFDEDITEGEDVGDEVANDEASAN